jgi:DNA polymerase I-like protein with 3'-5' exonuclease and polymerase domains
MMDQRLIYNSRDNFATRALFDEISQELTEPTRRVYEAFMGLQGALLGVQMRGIRVDLTKRKEIVKQLLADAATRREECDRIAGTSLFGESGGTSPKKLGEWLYGTLALRKQLSRTTGKPTTDEDALERVAKRTVAVEAAVPTAEKTKRKDDSAAVAKLILEVRDLSRQAGSLKDGLLDNGRMRTTLVAAGTESYRLSSHKTWNNKGFNQQNVDKRLRGCYMPDDGFEFVQQDQSKAESLTVAYLAGDEGYIRAHEEGNPHINVARLIWPKLDWCGEYERDQAYAEKHNIEGKSATRAGSDVYRISKVIQHGGNYGMTPHGVAYNAGMTIKDSTEAQGKYFDLYPGIPQWQEDIKRAIQERGYIECPGGFGRVFFGPRNDPGTWREAMSFVPQAVIAWTNHIVFARLFYSVDCADFRVLGHGHDAVLSQVRIGAWEALRARVVELSRVEWPVCGRTMVIPWKFKRGADWAAVS